MVPNRHLARNILVSDPSRLTAPEFAALQEIGRGPMHQAIPLASATRLLELRLAYRLLGEVRITAAGRTWLNAAD